RSFARHASRRQVFLPLDLLDRHGARLEDIYAGQATPALLAALAELRSDARRHLVSFEALLPQLPAAAMPTLLSIALVPGYLSAMEHSNYDPFRSVVEVP